MAGVLTGLAMMMALQQGVPGTDGSPPPLPPTPPGGHPQPHGRLFISPMGEPFQGEDPIAAWFAGADRNHDGVVTQAEFLADADRFFTQLDRGHDGEIDPDDIDYYETVLAPEIRTGGDGVASGGGRSRGSGGSGGGRHGGGGGRRGGGSGDSDSSGSTAPSGPAYDDVARGAARFGFFNYPEPITAADTNLNRGVDRAEFRHAAEERFAMLDKKGDGRLTLEELPKLSPPPARGGRQGWYGGRHRIAGDAAPPQSAPAREMPEE